MFTGLISVNGFPRTITCVILVLLSSCGQSSDTRKLETRIDSLERQLHTTYRPGFGEFMASIQVHHEKLWFAGQNKNWALADFEINEIKEALDDINTYCTDRPERKFLPMINGPLDSLSQAIKSQNSTLFNTGFISLTKTCNACHQATQHEFNVIKIPDSPPFSNQVFKPEEKK